jgi:hypothetical protein
MTDSTGTNAHSARRSHRAGSRYEFVIWAPSFEETSGGNIALHALCERLNLAGVAAAIWPNPKPRPSRFFGLPSPKAMAGYVLRGAGRRFSQGPFANPVAGLRDLRDAIVVYPEVVAGNPLRAKKVARWLLHRPGFHTGKVDFGRDDLFFAYHEHFNPDSDRTSARLTVTWVNPVYRDLGGTERSGSCYLLRKGKDRPLVHDPASSVLIDDLSHEEKAEIFSRTTTLYSYDPYTLYNVYAAVCGCIPVVVPPPGLTKEEWLPKLEDRYGLAFGPDDVPWAMATRDKMLDRIGRAREEEEQMLQNFISECRRRFGRIANG